jgi:hypothetical protein
MPNDSTNHQVALPLHVSDKSLERIEFIVWGPQITVVTQNFL